MPYSRSDNHGTRELLARITQQQAAKQKDSDADKSVDQQNTELKSTSRRHPAKSKISKTDKREPNTTFIKNADGSTSYRVQIRGRVDGKLRSICRTFDNLALARAWRRKTQAEIEIDGFPVEPEDDVVTVAAVLAARLSRDDKIQRSAKQYLRYLSEHSCWKATKCPDLTIALIIDFAEQMVAEGRQRQTVAGYMSIFAATLKRARKRGAPIPPQVVEDATDLLWEDNIVARSTKRDRRPTLDELDRLLSAAAANTRQRIPITKICVFAIYSTRRLGEICRLRWDDLNDVEKTILVRDMKHPRKRRGNDVLVDIPDEAMRIINTMPRESEYIFPFKPRSVGTAFRRHCVSASIDDLRFHDLRHEGISRLFEIGETDYFVRKISGHEPGGCIARYAHVRNKGDKFTDWKWLERVLR